MAFFSASQKTFAQAIARVIYANPFRSERIEAEQSALGDAFEPVPAPWNAQPGAEEHHPNLDRLNAQAGALLESLKQRRRDGARLSEADWTLYEDLVLFVLYHRCAPRFSEAIQSALNQERPVGRMPFFKEFATELNDAIGSGLDHLAPPGVDPAAHMFAAFFQIRRAFHLLFHYLVGSSRPMARLRAAAWESIFTHNLRRYRRGIYETMGDVPSLIVGPTGSGKELVARAIGMSRYIPFDPKTLAFTEDFIAAFHPVNLAALASTLIESELFGHRRGAFTGALQDHHGWFEVCPPHGAVFLDEIGELDAGYQVKLLRVLQTRQFQRIGETSPLRFQGKLIAATHRDLSRMIHEGRFREDFYYRLCADQLDTPTLREQLDDAPDDLDLFVSFIARRLVPQEELGGFTNEVVDWIRSNLPRDYAWSGNFRELEQCVRNLMIRRRYSPPVGEAPMAILAPRNELARQIAAGSLTLPDLLAHYCSLVYAQCGSYQETARRLGVDHRTIKMRLVPELVAKYKGSENP